MTQVISVKSVLVIRYNSKAGHTLTRMNSQITLMTADIFVKDVAQTRYKSYAYIVIWNK